MNYLAIDLGAESGRVMLGLIKDDKIVLEEIHRFPNKVIRTGNSLSWNVRSLWKSIDEGLGLAPKRGVPIRSISADSWGVDYILICGDKKQPSKLTGPSEPAFHYRDPRTEKSVEEFLRKVSRETIFEETGIQFMSINTLFQLAAEERGEGSRLDRAQKLLSHADYVNYLMSDIARTEESMASTFQLYNPIKRDWSSLLLDKLGIPRSLMSGVVTSGTQLGAFCDPRHWVHDCYRNTKIVATCSHDTGCAVAAVPAEGSNWAYLSSGTWSLMGIERAEPIINDKSRELNFTNEIGYGGTIRLLKNISGMWLLQECRRSWAHTGQHFDYAELSGLAESETTFASTIDPMDERFLAPPDMPQAIADFCYERGQPVPKTPAQFTRCIFESLARLYAKTLRQLEELTGQKIDRLHIVGGGSKNNFLNQLTANACGIPVYAGPVEATALGNIVIQAITAGEIENLPAARRLIARNFPPTLFEPA